MLPIANETCNMHNIRVAAHRPLFGTACGRCARPDCCVCFSYFSVIYLCLTCGAMSRSSASPCQP